jgi:anti-sigma-K factor RskA
MDTADLHTLTGAYAADALDDLERRAVEQHLQACPECAEEVRGLRETVARLADAVAVVPPPRVREGVLARIAVTAQVPPVAAAPGRPGRRAPGRRGIWAVAAGLLLATSAGTGTLAWNQHQEAQESRALAGRVAAVVADPAARRVSGRIATGGDVTLVVAGDRAVVVTAAMPELPADRVYQLWIVRPEGTQAVVTSAGLGPGAREAAGSWTRLVEGVRAGDSVALSVEPSGGSVQPTTTPIVALKA